MNRKKKKDKHSEKTISKLERAVEEDEQLDKRTPAQKKFEETQRKRVCAYYNRIVGFEEVLTRLFALPGVGRGEDCEEGRQVTQG